MAGCAFVPRFLAVVVRTRRENVMNATILDHQLLAHTIRVIGVALVMLAMVLLTAEVSVAIVDEGAPSILERAETSRTARDDCLAGRRRTGTSAFRLGVDPVPSCSVLLAQQTPGAQEFQRSRSADEVEHRRPGLLP